MDDTTDMRYLLAEDLLRNAASASSSGFALQELTNAVSAVDQLLTSEVERARETGWTWEQIAQVLGVSRQAAWQRYAGAGSGRRR